MTHLLFAGILCGSFWCLVPVATPIHLATQQGNDSKDSLEKISTDWKEAQSKLGKLVREVTNKEEQRKLAEQYRKPIIDRCLRLAESEKNPVSSIKAYVWLISNFASDERAKKSVAIVEKFFATASLDDIDQLLECSQLLSDASVQIFQRIKQEPNHPKASSILIRVCFCTLFGPQKNYAVGKAATEFFISHYAMTRDASPLPDWLMHQDDAEWVRLQLDALEQKSNDPEVRANIKFALGMVLSGIDLASQEQAVKLLTEFVDQRGRTSRAYEVSQAKQCLEMIRTLGLGKPAPEISGQDLDNAPLKISDYRGKVVLLDFWGFW